MTTTNWIFANVCCFILFIVDFPAYVVDNWTCEDIIMLNICYTRHIKYCHCIGGFFDKITKKSIEKLMTQLLRYS